MMESPQPAQVPPRLSSPSSPHIDTLEKWSLPEPEGVSHKLPLHGVTDEKHPPQQQPKDANVHDAQISPEGSSNSTSDVRYVLSGQPTGWAAMAEKVRAYDEEKVKDTKEDIDTLLVFAGLFSAVLTAFLIESYQKLSPDTSSQMLSVMQQIALQTASYNMVNGVINATSQPPMNIIDASSQPFQPSPAAIRVNVLWFSSLIFSLVTASFGMLVKQWLREYLAVENPSPQARLRIRHFRYPELMRWNVFEIAAILPLLQQIALALFFIGLCYFTESVHESVGHTSLPLVAGWAFCFSIFTILPIFFPRCPYKTTLLKRLLQSIHIHSVQALLKITNPVYTWYRNADYNSFLYRASIWSGILRVILEDHAEKSDERSAVIEESADLDILGDVDALQSNDELLGSTILESLHQIRVRPTADDVVDLVCRVLQHRQLHVNSSVPGPLDLRTLSRSGHTAIIDILSYGCSPALLRHLRSGKNIATSKVTLTAVYIFFSPSGYPLPKSGLKVLSDVLQYSGVPLMRLLAGQCPRPVQNWDDTFFLLIRGVSKTLEDLDVNLTSSLCYFEALMDARIESAKIAAQTAEVNEQFPDGSFTVQGDWTASPWHEVMSTIGCKHSSQFLIWTVDRALRHMKKPASFQTCQALAYPNTPVAMALQPAPTSRLVDGLVGMWQMAYIKHMVKDEGRFRAVIEECFAMKESTVALLKTLGILKTRIIIETHTRWLNEPCGSWLLREHPQRKLQNFIEALHELSSTSTQLNDRHHTSFPITTTHVLHICYIALRMVEPNVALQYADQWRSVFDVLADLGNESLDAVNPTVAAGAAAATREPSHSTAPPTQIVGDASSEECQELVEQCLKMVQSHDIHVLFRIDNSSKELISAYDDWLTLFKDEDSVVGDSFVKMLARIHTPPGCNMRGGDSVLQYFRLEKLGLRRGEDYSANTADNGSSDTMSNTDSQNHSSSHAPVTGNTSTRPAPDDEDRSAGAGIPWSPVAS